MKKGANAPFFIARRQAAGPSQPHFPQPQENL